MGHETLTSTGWLPVLKTFPLAIFRSPSSVQMTRMGLPPYLSALSYSCLTYLVLLAVASIKVKGLGS